MFFSNSNSSALVAFHQSVLGADFRKPAEWCGIKRNVRGLLLPDINGAPTKVGTASLCGPVDDVEGSPTHRAQSLLA